MPLNLRTRTAFKWVPNFHICPTVNDHDRRRLTLARHDADRLAPIAAEAEAKYRNLVRFEPSILAKCLIKYKDSEATVQLAKAQALCDPEYLAHLKDMTAAQRDYLRANRSFEAIIEWMKLATSFLYKENSRMKAGV